MGEVQQICILQAFGELLSEEYPSSRWRTMFRREEEERVSSLELHGKGLETLQRRGLVIVLGLESRCFIAQLLLSHSPAADKQLPIIFPRVAAEGAGAQWSPTSALDVKKRSRDKRRRPRRTLLRPLALDQVCECVSSASHEAKRPGRTHGAAYGLKGRECDG